MRGYMYVCVPNGHKGPLTIRNSGQITYIGRLGVGGPNLWTLSFPLAYRKSNYLTSNIENAELCKIVVLHKIIFPYFSNHTNISSRPSYRSLRKQFLSV